MVLMTPTPTPTPKKPDTDRDQAPQAAPHPDAAMFAAIAAGLTEGDEIVVEEIDGKLYEVMRDGRRVPLFD
jgi:hypothetical protein